MSASQLTPHAVIGVGAERVPAIEKVHYISMLTQSQFQVDEPEMQASTRAFAFGLMLALLMVAVVDRALRIIEPRLSGDIANTFSFPGRVAELLATDGKRVAAVGNLLIGDVLDTDACMTAHWLDFSSGTGRAIKLVPDASGISVWHCIAHYRLAGTSPPPNLVIVALGWNQLSDQNRLSLTRAFNALCPTGAMRDFSALSGQVGINT